MMNPISIAALQIALFFGSLTFGCVFAGQRTFQAHPEMSDQVVDYGSYFLEILETVIVSPFISPVTSTI